MTHRGRVVADTKSYLYIDPSRVLIDHAEEHTLPLILDSGFWTGLTLYPQTKVSPERAIDMIERYGADRICVASACDWGPSVPTAVPHFALAMRRRGHDDALIDRVIFDNPADFLGQSAKFRVSGMRESASGRGTVGAVGAVAGEWDTVQGSEVGRA